jgi:hypothetical protein
MPNDNQSTAHTLPCHFLFERNAAQKTNLRLVPFSLFLCFLPLTKKTPIKKKKGKKKKKYRL